MFVCKALCVIMQHLVYEQMLVLHQVDLSGQHQQQSEEKGNQRIARPS